MTWQTIDTAPKDGTEIIGVHYREWKFFKPVFYGPWTIAFDRGKWRSSWDRSEVVNYMSDFGTEYKEPDCDPTHWQPMPSTDGLAVSPHNLPGHDETMAGLNSLSIRDPKLTGEAR